MATDGGQPWRDRSCYLAVSMSPADQSTKSLKPPDTKHRLDLLPIVFEKGRNGNPANPFASNSSVTAIARLAGGNPVQYEPRGMPMQYRRGNCILLLQTNYQAAGRTHSLSDYTCSLIELL